MLKVKSVEYKDDGDDTMYVTMSLPDFIIWSLVCVGSGLLIHLLFDIMWVLIT